MAKGRRARQPRVVDRQDTGTPETVRKCRRDVVAGLYAAGRLNGNQAKAAEQVREIHERIHILHPHHLDSAGYISQSYRPRTPLDRLGELDWDWRRNYIPMLARWHAEHIKGPDATVADIVMAVVVDNMTLSACDRYHRTRLGLTFRVLKKALQGYAVFAGWERPNLVVDHARV